MKKVFEANYILNEIGMIIDYRTVYFLSDSVKEAREKARKINKSIYLFDYKNKGVNRVDRISGMKIVEITKDNKIILDAKNNNSIEDLV